MRQPMRGDIWLVNLDPTKGREQAGTRPALIISSDYFNTGPADLVVLVPLTTTEKRIPLHVEIDPPEGGVRKRSFAKCENIRSVSKRRLIEQWGSVSDGILRQVGERVRLLLEL